MDNLTSETVFSDGLKQGKGLSLSEISRGELVSLSVSSGHQDEFRLRFKQTYGVSPPRPGALSAIKGGQAFWSGQDQYMLYLDGKDIEADMKVSDIFQDLAYSTLQSDGWVLLQIDGEGIKSFWQTFIPLDFASIKPGTSAPTHAHHLAVIVLCLEDGTYWFLSPRSSAESFKAAILRS